MPINYESLRKFARENDDNIRLYASPRAEIVILKDGTPDFFDVIEHATIFSFAGKVYTRGEFEELISKPSLKLK